MEGDSAQSPPVVEINCNTESLERSTIFHLVNDILAFLLYMHQQIPFVFEDLCLQFDRMKTELKELEMEIARFQGKASLRRKQLVQKRELKRQIKSLEKFMKAFSSLQSALQLIITQTPNIQEVVFILGSSPIRPLHVYQICFSGSKSNVAPQGEFDFIKSRTAEGLSRKAIRGLISMGAGSSSFPGALKLFLLIKAQSSLNLPFHFLPKHDFRCNKKIVPLRMQFKCRSKVVEMVNDNHASRTGESGGFDNYAPSELIWYASKVRSRFFLEKNKAEIHYCANSGTKNNMGYGW